MAKTITLLATQNANANATSGVLDIADLLTASVQVVFTGANVVGTLTLQGSTDNSNWALIPNTTVAVTASTGHIYDITPTGVQYFRAVWVYTSGAGNITVTGKIKDMLRA
jgi:hypothetical protein